MFYTCHTCGLTENASRQRSHEAIDCTDEPVEEVADYGFHGS